MSMEHKAFLFNSQKFHLEIEEVLHKCCHDNKGKEYAIEYIDKNYDNFKSPYTGEELDDKWINQIESGNIQEYMDFILTACYDPNEDMGLEYSWELLIEEIKQMHITSNAEQWVLGKPIVCNGVLVDPGAMGLGIVDAEEVSYIKNILIDSRSKLQPIEVRETNLYDLTNEEIIDAYDDLCNIYKLAEGKGFGIMMTF